MTIQTSPNGVTTQQGSGSSFTNLGAVAAASVTLTQATLADHFKLSIVAGTTTRVLPPMPVGAEITFEASIPDAASFLQIQEIDSAGVAQPLAHRRASGALAQFGMSAPCLLLANAATGLTVAADQFSCNQGATGRIEANAAAIGTVLITYKKVNVNTAGTADGWTVTTFRQQGFDVT